MEYFNFEDASHAIQPLDLEDYSSLAGEMTQDEGNDCFESLFFDKSHALPIDKSGPVKLKLMNDIEIEVIPAPEDASLNYPMFRAKVACELCAKMGLDCFLTARGTGHMITGCTCCISLYRECSFTHPKIPKGLISTFPGISEDQQESAFTITERRKSLKSFEEARGRKTGARFPRDAVKILKQWLGEHSDHPYPNEREKDELKQLTGLKRSQISNWLANARRRGKVRPISESSSPVLGAVDIPQQKNMADLNPLDRWKASPPENEPASMTAIARAVTSAPLPGRDSNQSSLQGSRQGSRTSSRKNSSEDDSGFSMFRAPSISSFGTRESSNSDMTFASSRSNRSKGSLGSQERRRRRRAPMTQRVAAQQAKSRSARIFQCTFCTDTFPTKYDWQRHEKSLHLALERWTCCPEGGIVTVPLTGCQHCVFCQAMNPTPEHLESHNFMACQEKTLQERTFYRKDHLRQHLKLMHGVKFESTMEAWKTTTNEIKSTCGFCPSKFSTWQQRADHLAAHFRNGADMSNWSHGWGFEPHVEKLVENAIPPYLIGHEKLTMEPYVARHKAASSSGETGLTRGTSVDDSEIDQITKDSNCWGRLEQELSKFIVQRKNTGILPTDKELQDKARLIIYEDSDPWNWTCADNQQWLDTFKFQHGCGPVTEAMQSKQLADVPIMAPYVIRGGLKTKNSSSQPSPVPEVARMTPTNFNTLNTLATPVSDQNMELDFDSIDFSNLDLGMMDDGTFDQELDFQGMELVGEIPNSFGQPQPETTFGSFGMIQGQQLPNNQNSGNFMTDQQINQLTGYKTGFH